MFCHQTKTYFSISTTKVAGCKVFMSVASHSPRCRGREPSEPSEKWAVLTTCVPRPVRLTDLQLTKFGRSTSSELQRGARRAIKGIREVAEWARSITDVTRSSRWNDGTANSSGFIFWKQGISRLVATKSEMDTTQLTGRKRERKGAGQRCSYSYSQLTV